MTSGSGNGWPDVVKVPAQKAEHDPLCPNAGLRWEKRIWCTCVLIAKVRADEREKVKSEYVPVLMEHLRREAGFSDLRAKVEALRDNAVAVQQERGVPSPWTAYVGAYNHVLALIDGGSDE